MSFKLTPVVALLIIGLLTINLTNGERVRYDNYRTYKVIPANDKQLEILQSLDSSDSLLFLDGVHVVGKELKVIAAPHKVPDFLNILGVNEIRYELLDSNVQKSLDSEEIVIAPRDSTYGWSAYYELETTYQWLQSLASQYPGVVTLIEAGKTYEKRTILGVKISKNNGKENKPGIFLEAGIHAREWIAPATTTYIINKLLTSEDTAIQNIATNYDWYIFPHANPDGYAYTHTTNRMWRKTRTPYGNCYGADPNRNWDISWNTVGASSSACSDTYAGPKAFSEIEVKSLADYIKSLEGKIQLYISFHAYSQYLLYPFGHTAELPSNVEDYKRVYDVTINAINKQFSTKYTGGNIYDAIYPAAGSSIDWAYSNVGTKMAFCFELRPSSNSVIYGFQLPASQIEATGAETLDGIVAMVGEVDNLGYFNV